MRAWKGIKELPPDDPNSFFMLGGFHGEPFRGPGAWANAWWGGYCQHGTVLFPTWHRAYLYKLENALRSIPGCASVTLPFWDECSEWSQENGIPGALTVGEVRARRRADRQPAALVRAAGRDRRPGLAGQRQRPQQPELQQAAGLRDGALSALGARRHARRPAGDAGPQRRLPELRGEREDARRQHHGLADDAGLFGRGDARAGGQPVPQVPRRAELHAVLEHHLDARVEQGQSGQPGHRARNRRTTTSTSRSAGSTSRPTTPRRSRGANGDMGENDTAALDPIFFFHHCFIDYAFWIWQRRQGATKQLHDRHAGPGRVLRQQPAAGGRQPGRHADDGDPADPVPARRRQRLRQQRLRRYRGPARLHLRPGLARRVRRAAGQGGGAVAAAEPTRQVRVSGIDRSKIAGSFIIAAYAEVDGAHRLVGAEAVLSRWTVAGCANCQTQAAARAASSRSPPTRPTAGSRSWSTRATARSATSRRRSSRPASCARWRRRSTCRSGSRSSDARDPGPGLPGVRPARRVRAVGDVLLGRLHGRPRRRGAGQGHGEQRLRVRGAQRPAGAGDAVRRAVGAGRLARPARRGSSTTRSSATSASSPSRRRRAPGSARSAKARCWRRRPGCSTATPRRRTGRSSPT